MKAPSPVLIALGLILPLVAGCATRDLWQQPEAVIARLEIAAGQTVADVGAGDGYFIPYLSSAVGPEGTVYAVDVDADKIEELELLVAHSGLTNVKVVHAPYDDPALPDGEIDLVFLCNTYHHIDERADYFRRTRGDLTATGRVAVLEPNEDATGIVSLFHDEGHTSSAPRVRDEMALAGFETTASYDFLASQIFEVFSPKGP
jgi:ubiquinone/menaquinone biosynthesis C-methylase UbiE